jgi:apolipoprotein N-acyltransferase
MSLLNFIKRPWAALFAALIAGSILVYGFAPYGFWPAALLSPSIFSVLLYRYQGNAFFLSFAYFFGVFANGVGWVFVSIHTYGMTAFVPALLMTAIFVAFLALVSSIPFIFYAKYFRNSKLALLLAFPAIWVVNEWLRSWLLTGFPWLYIGYAHTDTSLGGYAPIGGVYLISFLSVASAQAALYLGSKLRSIGGLRREAKQRLALTSISIIVIWGVGNGISSKHFTEADEGKISVALLQPNVPLEVKWDPRKHRQIALKLNDSADLLWQHDLQLWPEAAIPAVYSQMEYFIESIDRRGKEQNSAVITGVLSDESFEEIYNSVIGLGKAEGIYHKQRLVPFGEYVPLEQYLRGLIEFFNLPSSIIQRGPYLPEQLSVTTRDNHHYTLAPFICYEVVYPDLVVKNSKQASVLATISNDAWFGRSAGPLQHFQMARMRAMEHRKFMLRSTNTGLSGIIDPFGRVTAKAEQFVHTTVSGTIYTSSGLTPYAKIGSMPIILLSFLLLVCTFFITRRNHES